MRDLEERVVWVDRQRYALIIGDCDGLLVDSLNDTLKGDRSIFEGFEFSCGYDVVYLEFRC